MKFNNDKAVFTPPEATFVETACGYRQADDIKLSVRSAALDWALQVLPEDYTSRLQGEECAYILLRARAEESWQPEQGETIPVSLDRQQLGVLKELATLAVQTAKEEAGNVDRNYEIDSVLTDIFLPEEADQIELGEWEADSYKKDVFEESIANIAIGYHVVSVINDYEQRNPRQS
ncbi:MAG TPA: hypothetical protein VK983_00100 [Candidatus Limnocylindrales bacterium]|nr:hypothetical protein [Candidatus Limnocylindrales bacterium]